MMKKTKIGHLGITKETLVINGSFMIRERVNINAHVSIRGLGRILGDVTISGNFKSISRLIVSGYDEPITLKGGVNIGSGIYLSENLSF